MKRLFLLVMSVCLLSIPLLAGDDTSSEPAADNTAKMVGETKPLAEFVAPGDSLPHLRYLADGKLTLNDRCPVRKVKLNPRMGASYVNGRPVGFC